MPLTTTHDVTVLVIEDEVAIRRFLRTTLPPYGYRLCEATTGEEGLAQATSRNSDIIPIDLGLPDMDGTEVIQADPGLGDHTDPRIVCQRPRAGEGGGTGSRRRRLCHEAVPSG